jgi:hypothetical protein
VTNTLSLAAHPSAIAVNPTTNQIYIAYQAFSSVQVLEGKTNGMFALMKAGSVPYAMAVDSASGQVYVTNFSSRQYYGDPFDVRKLFSLLLVAGAVSAHGQSWPKPPKFRVVALAERASGDHQKVRRRSEGIPEQAGGGE